jgi:hypothetical protein
MKLIIRAITDGTGSVDLVIEPAVVRSVRVDDQPAGAGDPGQLPGEAGQTGAW